MPFNKFLQKNSSLYFSYIVSLLFALFFLYGYGNTLFSIAVNQFHSPGADLFFTWFTHLGDGLFALALSLLLMRLSAVKGIALFLSYGISALITQALKHLVFEDVHRPALLLRSYSLHFVDGIEINYRNSFPSGHSTSAFAVFVFLGLLSRKPVVQACCILLAALVAFSRIYLLQHFLTDTIAGSLIGILTASILFYTLIEKNRGELMISRFKSNKK